MTSRDHARRLMLILLASEGTALREEPEPRPAGRERPVTRGVGLLGSGDAGGTGQARERGFDEWRLWAAQPSLRAAHRAP